MAVSIDQFGKSLVASGLITADELKELWNGIPADQRPKAGDGFARLLVAQQKLTEFQASELLAGRGARLVLGDYAVLQEIGAGGMGQVYKAQHRRMKRVVALKVMSNAAMKDEAAVKRFQREVQAAARLEHPNIVTAYDSGEAGSVKYLVMQFVDGGDLSDLVKKNGPLSVEQACDYVLQAAKGLAFAHAEGVIHRDIKPANLLLDPKGTIKILDMGLARIEGGDDGLTATEQVMGTVDYMSPEQAANTKSADARADIYSLGCTLWFLLAARKVYESDSMIGRLMAHRDAPLPSLVKTRDDVPWALEQAFHKMIAKRPQDRFQTMTEVIAAIEPFAGSGASGGGSGASLSTGSQSAEMASFLNSFGPAAAAQVKSPASKTSIQTEATAQFTSPDVGTDPKSPVFAPPPRAGGPAKPQLQPKSSAKKPPMKLIAGGVGAVAASALLGLWIFAGSNVAPAKPESGSSATAGPDVNSLVKPVAQQLTPYEILTSPDWEWTAPEELGPTINSAMADTYPLLVGDGKTLLYFSYGWGNRWLQSTREDAGKPFPHPQPFELVSSKDGSQFTMSTDGLNCVFVRPQSNDFGTKDIWQASRATVRDSFSPAQPLTEINTPEDESAPALAPDGRALIYREYRQGARGRLVRRTRTSRNEPFGPPDSFVVSVSGAPDLRVESHGGMTFSADQRIVIFGHQGTLPRPTLWISRREKVTDPFEPAVELSPSLMTEPEYRNGSPSLSADGTTLVFNRIPIVAGVPGTAHIWQMRRVPKTKSSPQAATTSPAAAPPSFVTPATPPPPGDYVLELAGFANKAGAASVAVPSLLLPEVGPLTLEARVCEIGHNEGLVLGTEDLRLRLAGGRWAIKVQGQVHAQPTPIEARRWYHLAAVRTGADVRFYVDGKLVHSRPLPDRSGPQAAPRSAPLEIGGNNANIRLDEIRISKSVRYTNDFPPPPKFEPDAVTLALYHCDEGAGDVLKDSSHEKHDGKIIRPNWKKPDGSPIPTTMFDR